MTLAPIVLFVYNRPLHTSHVLEALSRNDLADQSTLYVYLDSPKKAAVEGDAKNVEAVERVVNSKSWCKFVHLIKRPVNYGLADNIVGGVTEIVKRHGRVIVLEDDIVTAPGFLKYMNAALNLYEGNERVMHISAYMFPVKGRLPETFFYRQTSCWGWATWARAWKKFEGNPRILLRDLMRSHKIKESNFDGTGQFLDQLYLNINGRLRTWAVKWQFSVILNGGLCLHPGRSLTKNIGLDGSGQNSGINKQFDVQLTETVNVTKVDVRDHEKVYHLLKKFYKPHFKFANHLKIAVGRLLPIGLFNGIRLMINRAYRQELLEERRLRRLPRYTKSNVTLHGTQISILDAPSYLFTKHEIFTEQIYSFTTQSSKPYILDCGANIGLSIIFFKKIFPEAEIIAFEPDRTVFDVLSTNIEAFGFLNVSLINKGLWNQETTLPFFSEGADAGRIAKQGQDNSCETIETTRLRFYLQRPVDFLKMDIEGAETVVLRDCSDLLRNVNNLFVEYHSYLGDEQSLDELLSILKLAGFRYSIQQHGVISKRPFMKIEDQDGMDILLNISAFRSY